MSVGDYAQLAAWAAVGLVMMFFGWMAWRGHWDTWPHSRAFGFLAVTLLPTTGLLFASVGVATFAGRSFLVGLLALLVFLLWILSLVLFLWRPAWFGPAWYLRSEYDRRYDRVQLSGEILAAEVDAENHSEHAARTERLPEVPLHRVKAALSDPSLGRPSAMSVDGLAGGHLLLYTHEIVFVGDRTDDMLRPGPTVRAMRVGDITDVALLAGVGPINRGGVRFTTSDGEVTDFRLRGPSKLISLIRKTYTSSREAGPAA